MPFGISFAPDEFQRRQNQAVERLPGVLSIANDNPRIFNYQSIFLPSLSDICEPLRKPTVKDTVWSKHEIHDCAVEKIKRLVTSDPVPNYYDSQRKLTLQCDSSKTGLDFASRTLTDTETRYAKIDKELLAVVFGLERFHQYAYGQDLIIQSDHKTLAIIMKIQLHTAPKRLQRMLLRLQNYSTKLEYHPGKEIHLTDTVTVVVEHAYETMTKQEHSWMKLFILHIYSRLQKIV